VVRAETLLLGVSGAKQGKFWGKSGDFAKNCPNDLTRQFKEARITLSEVP
jgi:hypothetical protein